MLLAVEIQNQEVLVGFQGLELNGVVQVGLRVLGYSPHGKSASREHVKSYQSPTAAKGQSTHRDVPSWQLPRSRTLGGFVKSSPWPDFLLFSPFGGERWWDNTPPRQTGYGEDFQCFDIVSGAGGRGRSSVTTPWINESISPRSSIPSAPSIPTNRSTTARHSS